MNRKRGRDKHRLERNLDQLCHVASKIILYAAGGEASSKRYFMDKPLETEACSDASDVENRTCPMLSLNWHVCNFCFSL